MRKAPRVSLGPVAPVAPIALAAQAALALAACLTVACGGSGSGPATAPVYLHSYEDPPHDPVPRETTEHGNDGDSSGARSIPNDHNKGGTKSK